MKMEEKLFVVRKYVKAKSVKDAIKKERQMPVDECYLDDKWFAEAVVRGFEVKKV